MNWEYKEYQPEARLNDYIDCIWKENYFSSSANQSRKHPIFPDLSIELLFTQSNIIRNNYVQRSTDIQKSQLSGLRTRVQTFKTDNSAVIAVRIKPEALYMFVDHAIDEITDYTLEAKLAFGF